MGDIDTTPHRLWFDIVEIFKRTDKKWDLMVRTQAGVEKFVWVMRKCASVQAFKDRDSGEWRYELGVTPRMAKTLGLLDQEAENG
jgi:hypothetical protein